MLNQECALVQSEDLPEHINTEVKGYDFNDGINFELLFQSYNSVGIQATNFSKAVNVINDMLKMKEIPLSEEEKQSFSNPIQREKTNCTIFLGYTSNVISSGLREQIRYIAEHNQVDVIVSSAGGIEEDFIKCFRPSYVGDFREFNDSELRSKGINRIGNMLVPNSNYVEFESWLTPLLHKMHDEQDQHGINWTPSKFIRRLGKEINDPSSVYYWCYRNNIPVFCPSLTDGSIGDMLYFYSITRPGLRLDLIEDIRLMNVQATAALHSGMIILGGGVIKHHIANANMMRNGADFSVYINTGNEFEASDSGAPPEEAVSWGKIKSISKPVKLHAEVSLVFPIIVALTFAKRVEAKKASRAVIA